MKSLFTKSSALLALALSAMVATTTFAHATSIGIAPGVNTAFQVGPTALAGWSESTGPCNSPGCINGYAYNFAFSSASQAVNTGPNNTLGVVMDGATTGTNFLALDADYGEAALSTSTTLSGLSQGATVTVTFGFAGTQQLTGSDSCGTCTGNFDALLAVTLGGSAPTAGGALLNAATGAGAIDTTTSGCPSGASTCIVSQEWSGWESETLTFTASSSSEVLSFIASAPSGQANVPAFALVDNVAYTVTPPTATPEPSSLMLLSTGLLGLGGFLRMRYKNSLAAKA
jgi:hypothetical protein